MMVMRLLTKLNNKKMKIYNVYKNYEGNIIKITCDDKNLLSVDFR